MTKHNQLLEKKTGAFEQRRTSVRTREDESMHEAFLVRNSQKKKEEEKRRRIQTCKWTGNGAVSGPGKGSGLLPKSGFCD